MIEAGPRRAALSLLMVCVFIVACDQQARFDDLVPKDEAAFAERYLQLLANGDLDAAEAKLDPRIVSPEIRSVLAILSETFPKTNPISVKLIGSEPRVTDELWQAQFTFEYEYPGQWLHAGVLMHRDGADLLIDRANVMHQADSIENTHRFTLSGKTPVHYTILVAAGLVVLLMFYSMVVCIRSPHTERKWLWIIFIVLGLGTVNLDWTSGIWDFEPLQVLLFGVKFKQSLYLPTIVQFAMPIGAIAFNIGRILDRIGDGPA